ncbi:MAG: c-type cytochrome [Salegentibacter sp.]
MRTHKRKRNLNLIVVFFIIMMTGVIVWFFFIRSNENSEALKQEGIDPLSASYDISVLDDSPAEQQIKYGYELFTKTAWYIGPQNEKMNMRYSGNNLACNNCHLNAGTRPYSGMLIGVINRFPQYRGRVDKTGSIEDRINGCMERSMNGEVLPVDGKEMKAFVSYLKWLNRYAPENGIVEGLGYTEIEIPNRPVDLKKGKQLFVANCVACHGYDGKGLALKDSPGYLYPPLWGKDSYNNGAGMARVITAAQFIKTNMPFGVTFEDPLLTDEECYDLAGYINQQPRPVKRELAKDFPDLKRKPVSTPYPPYADSFSVEQHQLGPFQPIIDFYQEKYGIKKTK